MDRKYQIFVSSTYEDLRDEREEVIKACLNMGHIPIGMEMFNAADEEQWAVITRTIDQCDYYVVIVAHRYGSTTSEGISYTEKEYDFALFKGVPVLGFIIESSAPWPNDRVDKEQMAMQGLQRFKTKVKQKLVRFWRDRFELQAHFAMSLSTSVNLTPRRGWVRAPEEEGSDIAQTLSDLARENARLRKALEQHAEDAASDSVNETLVLLSKNTLGALRAIDVFRKAFPPLKSKMAQNDQFTDRDIHAAVSQIGEWKVFLKLLFVYDLARADAPGRYSFTPLAQDVFRRIVILDPQSQYITHPNSPP